MKAPLNFCLAVSTVAASWVAIDYRSKLAERDSRIAELIRERDRGPSIGMGTAQTTPPPGYSLQHPVQDRVPSAPGNTVATTVRDPKTKGIDSVLETLQSIQDPRKRDEYLNQVFRKASTMGVSAVLEWVRQLPKADRDSALLALHSEWSGDSVAGLTNRLFGRPIALALGDYLLKHQLTSPEQAAAFANEFVSVDARAGLLTQAAVQLAATDPGRAYDLGEGLAGRQQAEFFKSLVSAWTAKDPQAAWQWVNQIAESSKRMQMQANFIVAESAADPLAAAQKLSLLEAGGDLRLEAVRDIAATWAGKDTAAALRWAEALPSETDREAAKAGIGASAPVGIGVALTPGDGHAVIQGTLPGGPAERSRALMQGDRILAATDAKGAWVDFRGLQFDEMSTLIRGKSGTSVLLQVQSPNQDKPRIVAITREQIIRRTP